MAAGLSVGLTGLAAAQERTTPPAETAGKPAADTREPGKTATDAVTNPATVPPSEGAVGTGKPPATTAPATPTPGR
jgi:hypothetical protein